MTDEIKKLYLTAKEAATALDITVGMVYFWRGRVKRDHSHRGKVSLKELERMRKLIC